jgi:hypothetical protein
MFKYNFFNDITDYLFTTVYIHLVKNKNIVNAYLSTLTNKYIKFRYCNITIIWKKNKEQSLFQSI